jgi:hypothetical protein
MAGARRRACNGTMRADPPVSASTRPRPAGVKLCKACEQIPDAATARRLNCGTGERSNGSATMRDVKSLTASVPPRQRFRS